MKATLYEALGIAQTASPDEVREALRRQIRKYYAKTRDGQGNVEEALRFINHASRILSDGERRAHYDKELARSTGLPEQRVAHVVSNEVNEGGTEHTDVQPPPAELTADDILETGLDADDYDEGQNRHHPGLTERVTALGRSTLVTLGVCALFAGFIGAAIVFVTPQDAVLIAKQVLVWLTLTLVALTFVYGVVHGLVWVHRRHGLPVQAGLVPQTDLAILNWRREKSVFLGTNQPQEDASWIFQLRMAELERAKAGRTSEPRPWNRLGARLYDYAIWGLVLALLLSELRRMDFVSEAAAYWLGHPLIAPMVITATWIPIEALLVASLQTTPGKWLFGCYLQFSISDAYAPRDPQTQLVRGLKRAFRVWWEGVGCGFPLLTPVLIAIAYERVMQRGETRWDSSQDCLVTHSPPGVLNSITGVCGLAAMLWLYGVAWHQPMAESFAWARRAAVEALPSTPAILSEGFVADGGLISNLRSGVAASSAGNARTPSLSEGNRKAPELAGPIDPELTNELAERRARVAKLKAEGPRMLRAGNWRRAADLCRAWVDLDLGNPDAWRCLGQALQAQGAHKEAIAALRKVKQLDPADRSVDAAIDRSQKGIVTEFLNRYPR